MRARLTALSKEDGAVRGIATGCTFRRLVARIQKFEDEYALSTRAGTDCVGHMLRAPTDMDPMACVLKVDGIGAHDHVLRASMLGPLVGMSHAQSLAPFVLAEHDQVFPGSTMLACGMR